MHQFDLEIDEVIKVLLTFSRTMAFLSNCGRKEKQLEK